MQLLSWLLICGAIAMWLRALWMLLTHDMAYRYINWRDWLLFTAAMVAQGVWIHGLIILTQ